MGRNRKRISKNRRYEEIDISWVVKKYHITRIRHTEQPELYNTFSKELTQSKNFSPSPVFQEAFSFGQKIYWDSTKRSEEFRKVYLIWPFLFEVIKSHPKLKIWPEVAIEFTAQQTIERIPDYIVTKESDVPEPPYCVIMEAKKEDFEQGWGQALEVMCMAQNLNKQSSVQDIPVYGVVTTGKEWELGKMQGHQFIIFPPKTGLNVLESDENATALLSLLHIIFESCEKNIATTS